MRRCQPIHIFKTERVRILYEVFEISMNVIGSGNVMIIELSVFVTHDMTASVSCIRCAPVFVVL